MSIDEIFSTYDNFMSVYKGKGGMAREAMHIMAHVMCAAQDESLKKLPRKVRELKNKKFIRRQYGIKENTKIFQLSILALYINKYPNVVSLFDSKTNVNCYNVYFQMEENNKMDTILIWDFDQMGGYLHLSSKRSLRIPNGAAFILSCNAKLLYENYLRKCKIDIPFNLFIIK